MNSSPASTSHGSDQPAYIANPLTHRQVRTVFYGLMLTIFIAALNQTIVATALPTIGRELNEFENLSWLVTAYLLTATAVATLYGKLSDMHGRRTMMLIANGLFTLGSIACAMAPDMLTLILGRALQGLGGGGMLPLAQSIVADIVAPRERGRWQAYIGVAWMTAGFGGPVLGGFITEHWHWSGIFWINVPLGIAAGLLSNVTLRRVPRLRRRTHRLDVLGALLLMAAAIPFLLALTWGGNRYPWDSLTIVGLLIGSAILWFLFAWQLNRATEPFLPIEILNNRVMRWGTLGSTCGLGTAVGLTVFLPLYYEMVHGLAAAEAGLALAPIIALSTPGAMTAGQVMMRRRRYKWVAQVGLSCSALALAVLAVEPSMPLAGVIALLCIGGMGIGTAYPTTTVSVQNSVAVHQVGTTMGTMNFFRSLGSALIVAILGAIVLAGFGTAMGHGAAAAEFVARVAAGDIEVALVFRWVFAAAAGILALGAFAVSMMQEQVLRSGVKPPTAGAATAGPEPTKVAAE